MWWKFEDIETIHDLNAGKDVPYKDFLLSNVDWSEWPGGASEIEASQIYFKNRVAELEELVRKAYPMIVEDPFGVGVEITDFQRWKMLATQIVPPTPTSNPSPFQA